MDDRPKRDDFPATPEGLHLWGKAVRAWNELTGVTSDDLVNQWNEERKRA